MDDVEHLWPFRPCNVQWRWGQGTGKEGSCQVEFQSICGSCQNPGILYHAVDAKPTKLSPFPICFVNVFTPAGRMRYARTYSIILLLCFFVVVFCLHALYFFGRKVLCVADSVVESNFLFFFFGPWRPMSSIIQRRRGCSVDGTVVVSLFPSFPLSFFVLICLSFLLSFLPYFLLSILSLLFFFFLFLPLFLSIMLHPFLSSSFLLSTRPSFFPAGWVYLDVTVVVPNFLPIFPSLLFSSSPPPPPIRPRRLTFSWWGLNGFCLRHEPAELAHSFYSVLVSASVFVALSTVFHLINSPKNSPLSHSVLLVLSFFLSVTCCHE